ncbi:uncharacterized protein Bfra_009078 [Botrytis fragariae]|uniref:Uncharacterized protein n=1 Tax=Botrytis fragariae TaxID=1964551 RepID=A0A8H6ARI2_9HELO|nr:uncharacterized protein Bfra_009078 [Botrytis fragariae]KAF5872050.1 hypothetical protein Bfra_009078 [Botrytis fragariae]
MLGFPHPDEPRGRTVTPSGEKGPNSYGVYLTRRPRNVAGGRGEVMSAEFGGVVNITLFVTDMLVLAREVFEHQRETY